MSPRAHDGPPYPILVDEDVAGHPVSVWADPDVGQGTFYLYLPWEELAARPEAVVRVCVQPSDARLDEVCWTAEPSRAGQPYQRLAVVDFDRVGPWRVRLVFEDPEHAGELSTEVDVTPPGMGRIDLLWFLSPFLVVAFIWLRVVQRKHAYERDATSATTPVLAPPGSKPPP